jgi:hypothetical protein
MATGPKLRGDRVGREDGFPGASRAAPASSVRGLSKRFGDRTAFPVLGRRERLDPADRGAARPRAAGVQFRPRQPGQPLQTAA